MKTNATNEQPTRRARAIETIQRVVAAQYSQPLSMMSDKGRAEPVSTIRHIAILLCHELAGATYPQLARVFNRISHATPMHACRTIRNRVSTEPRFRDEVVNVRKLCEESLAAEGLLLNPPQTRNLVSGGVS
jgi:chromosomal replication initiation ATPase DnaA